MIEYDLIYTNNGRIILNVQDDVLPRKGDIYEVDQQDKELQGFRVSEVRHRLIINADKRSVFHEVRISPLERKL
ncbi:MAG: hypothetical protein ABIH25_04855 [Candidatus Woesearchaeota archaeon]